jgi:hypothetical protein
MQTDAFHLNCCINPIPFHEGIGKIDPHGDKTQGETKIVTVVCECENDCIVSFKPNPVHAENPNLKKFELKLWSGDVYTMNGDLQAVYEVHQAKKSHLKILQVIIQKNTRCFLNGNIICVCRPPQ